MRERTVTVREGELLGPVDWSYDFDAHGWDQGGAMNPESLRECVAALRRLDEGVSRDERWTASRRGGFLAPVLEVGMYDGWPYWKPTPSVCITGPFGPEWLSVFQLGGVRRAS